MSKRLSSGQTNTLLNYFQSPKGKTIKENKPYNAAKLKVPADGQEDFPVAVKKRKKISIIDSDSEDEVHTPSKATPAKKRKNEEDSWSESEEEMSGSEDRTPAKKPVKKGNVRKQLSDSDSNNVDTNLKPKKNNLKKIYAVKSGQATNKSNNSQQNSAPVVTDVKSNWLHNNLEFLQPNKIRDINKYLPAEPDYDSRTLFIPKDFLDQQTPAMRQWWILKSTHMDSVLFFKVGKFYELYHMDAVVGVEELGFSYMKGEFAHSGFPESAYHKMANALIEKGYKVARSEQTETPEMMAERCRKQGKTTKFDKVVNREICQISAKATCVYSAQLPEAMHALPNYLLAITEHDITSDRRRFGVCFIDTSLGVFHLGEFEDDKHCSQLLKLCSDFPPGLILTERKKVGVKLKDIINTYYKDVRKDTLASGSQFYSAQTTVEKLMNGNYFRDKDETMHLPDVIKQIVDGFNPRPEYELALKCLGACMWYLEDSKLDIQVISMGKFEMYQPLNLIIKSDVSQIKRESMILDSITIGNLNLLGSQGSLQKTLDYCHSAFGKRLLQQWICRPLCDIDKITERQEAVDELYKNTTMLRESQDMLKKMPDLERQIAKIHTYGNRYFAKDHPDSRAVFYEAATYSKRRINDLLQTLQGFELAQHIVSLFEGCESTLLRRLTQLASKGVFPDLRGPLKFFKEAFDQEEAQAKGTIIPKSGVDEAYDAAEEAIQLINTRLTEYLNELQRFFGCKLSYFGSDKKRFQIDIPEKFAKKVTSQYQLEGTKKGTKPSKRYSTSQSRQMLADMIKAENDRAKIIQDLNRRIFEKFSDWGLQWEQAVSCLSILDVLCSLAEYAKSCSHDVCIPKIEPITEFNKIVIQNGRHPCISNIDNFVPNDVKMGVEDSANTLLITGPNMGGKSTLMRQVAIICIMAQLGSFVPASKSNLNLIDRIFTRLGANDDIVQGQSTFLVELSEASLILQHATPYSLVLLDELGRGTSTHDGNAIATAYVQKLTQINCRTLFSTHYHSLVDHFIDRPEVQLGHMACMVENDEDPTEESVTFLYKMVKGRCPKSYGFNVANLAGLKYKVVQRAREIAKELEEVAKNQAWFRQLFASDVTNLKSLLSNMKL